MSRAIEPDKKRNPEAMTLTPNPAIETAIRNAEREYELYSVNRTGKGEWTVARWYDKSREYVVKADSETYDWTCNCPAFQKTQTVCKHCIICRMHEEEMAELEARADEWAATEGDRFFMAECQAEVMASVAGEWWG